MDNFVISRFDSSLEGLGIVERYDVGLSHVSITKDGQYIIQEPTISVDGEKIYNNLMKSIRQSITIKDFTKTDILSSITTSLESESRKQGQFNIWKDERESIEYYLKRNLIGYSEIDVLINDKYIEDILAVTWDKPIVIVHNKFQNYSSLITNVIFNSHEQMSKLIQRISQNYGDPPNDLKPMVSFTNENNIRFTFTGNKKITPDGCTISIRKPSVDIITIFTLLKSGMLSTLSASYLWIMMDLKGFGLIIGSPSSGKTTLINAMFTMGNPKWHYFIIEDALELRLRHPIVSRHQTTGNSSINGENTNHNSIGIFDLCKLSLRFKPDYVIVGEVLGKDAEGLFQVGASGSGCVSSFHATDPNDALTRLESPPINISKISTNLISYILHVSWTERENKRQRKILEITEPVPEYTDNGMIKKLYKIFSYDLKSDTLRVVPSKNDTSTDEVDRLVNKSKKLGKCKTILGIEDIAHDLKKRMSILQKIIDNDIDNLDEISKEIIQYYSVS